jgi:DNA-binding transcriptional MerR regulator
MEVNRAKMVLLHQNPGYTMTDLVEKSRLTDRQIRRCIAEGLVEGAEGKGPGARYSETTLRRLQLIQRLQVQKVEPLGRQLTLKEIKTTLDSLNEQQESQILQGLTFSFIDTEAREEKSTRSPIVESKLDHEYLDIHESASPNTHSNLAEEDFRSVNRSLTGYRPRRGTTFGHGDLGELGMLLQMLRDKLKVLAGDESDPCPTAGDAWVRVRTRSPMMEIHFKTPETASEQARIRALYRAVETVIEQGYGPYYD